MRRNKLFVKKKYFTREEANKMLPLVGAIATDVAHLAGELQQRHATWQRVQPGNDQAGLDQAHSEEMAQLQHELGRGAAKLEELMDELRELGVDLKGWDGLVDFPSLVDGREVCLCWRVGEPEVGYWHEIDAGFAGRQKLTPELTASEATIVNAR